MKADGSSFCHPHQISGKLRGELSDGKNGTDASGLRSHMKAYEPRGGLDKGA